MLSFSYVTGISNVTADAVSHNIASVSAISPSPKSCASIGVVSSLERQNQKILNVLRSLVGDTECTI